MSKPFLFSYPNQHEFEHLFSEVFDKNTYYCELESKKPKIIDAGAHVGLTTLYFKKLFPQASIIAIEPNSMLFSHLTTNIRNNQASEITLYNAALAPTTGQEYFYIDPDNENPWWSTGSLKPQGWTNTEQTRKIAVSTITLSSLLTEPADLLKLDIEGSEAQVLYEARKNLYQVHKILVEIHETDNQRQEVTQLLKQANFSISIRRETKHTKSKRLIILEAVRTS